MKNIEQNLIKKASDLDEEIQRLTVQKNQAAQREDFDEAHNLKVKIEALQEEKKRLVKREGAVQPEAARAAIPVSAPVKKSEPETLPNLNPAPKRADKGVSPQNDELIEAALSGKVQRVQELIDSGVDINSVDRMTGNTCMTKNIFFFHSTFIYLKNSTSLCGLHWKY